MRFGLDTTQERVKRAAPAPPPPLGLPLYEIDEACRLLRCGRTKVFELLKIGDLQGVKIGRRRLISGDSVSKLLSSRTRLSG